jgi:phosphohistidine phosphatase
MKLLLIRHAKADDRDEFAKTGEPDEKRPLASKGRKEMRAIARGLESIEPRIDVLATSPLTRAVETADAIAETFSSAARETIDALAPDAPFDDFAEWLRGHSGAALVAAVGHNPHLSELAEWLHGGARSIAMKKGSAMLLEFGESFCAGGAEFVWYRKPKELIALGASPDLQLQRQQYLDRVSVRPPVA